MRLVVTIALLMFVPVSSQAESIPRVDAARAFSLARELSDRDAGRLWKMPVCGPVLFADGETREVVTNQVDKEGQLHLENGMWVGKLPQAMHIANTALEWAGVRWTEIIWDLHDDPRDFARLLAHECFHRIQPALKLPATDALNDHLDSKDGRVWMFLEWRALERALAADGNARTVAIADALRFRAYRRALFKAAAENENRLEINEGLAEYTGVTLANPNVADRRAETIAIVRRGSARPSLVRSFAYMSGPAYGFLLDASTQRWRQQLTNNSDLGVLLQGAYAVHDLKTERSQVVAAARAYGSEDLIAFEERREQRAEDERKQLRERFIGGPVLVLPASKGISWSFDPHGLTPLGDNRIVYSTLKVVDEWGVLDAPGGGLVEREAGRIARVIIPAAAKADGMRLSGEGWTLDLKPGFRRVAGTRQGDEILRRVP
jgi:hypothetical protein